MLLEIYQEASLFKGEITSVSVPGLDGSFQILNNHTPIVSLLQKGTVSITAPSLEFSKR
jgi:F-type H+-transporting ATPase subunit epsilon